jgi:putative ABC transport system permease protein
MNLNVRPVLTALLRNRTGAILVAMQIAIALAVLVNALYITTQRIERMRRPTGIDVNNIFVMYSGGFTARFNIGSTLQQDLDYLRGLQDVVSATAINAIPLSDGGTADSITTTPKGPGPDNYNRFEIDEHGLEALGVQLVAGRNFRHEEIQPPLGKADASRFFDQVILSRAAAVHLFGQENPLGKPVYDSLGQVATVIGIVDPIVGSWPENEHPDDVFFGPRLAARSGVGTYYLVRTRPGRRDAVMRIAEEHLSRMNTDRVITFNRTLAAIRDLTYLGDRTMSIYLLSVTGCLIAVTCFGIFALATFNVSTRTKQIGTRRAVGARRGDIIQYFLIENGLTTSAGILVGCALALGAGYWLSLEYALPRLNLYYLVGGVLALWAIGQLAAWQPARRAARVSPSVATRTV